MPWLFLLVERVSRRRIRLRMIHSGGSLLGNPIEINRAHTRSHYIIRLNRLLDHLVLCQLGIWLKRVLFFKLLLLGLFSHLLLLVLHNVALVYEEISWVHDLLVNHVFFLQSHLASNLSLSLVGEPSRVLGYLWLEL